MGIAGSSRRIPGLHLEPLEDRIAPAGAVAVSVAGGNLSMTGDADANSVQVDNLGLAPGQVRVTGLGGTLVNGAAEAVLDGWTGGIKARMGDGADEIELDVPSVAKDINLDLGKGDDTVTMIAGTSFGGKITVKGSDGNDVVDIEAFASGDINIDGGKGDNVLTINNAVIDGKLTVKNLDGNDMTTIMSADISGAVGINNGHGNSSVSFTNSDAASFKLASQDGQDEATLLNATVGAVSVSCGGGGSLVWLEDMDILGALSVKAGDGNDEVHVVNMGIVGATAISTGDGDADITVDDCDLGVAARPADLKITAGKGLHVIDLHDLSIGRSLSIAANDGGGQVLINDVGVSNKDLSVKLKAGADEVSIINVGVDGKTSIDTGAGADIVRADYFGFEGSFTLKTGADNDYVAIEADGGGVMPDSWFGGKVNVDMGTGDDNLLLGEFGVAGSFAFFESAVLLNGGSGTDSVDYQDNGNTYLVDPVSKGFETEA